MDGSRSSDLERPETEQLVDDVGDQRFALEQAQRHGGALALDHADDQTPDLGLRRLARNPRQPVQVEPVQQILVDPAFQLLVVRASRVHRAAACRKSHRNHLTCPFFR